MGGGIKGKLKEGRDEWVMQEIAHKSKILKTDVHLLVTK